MPPRLYSQDGDLIVDTSARVGARREPVVRLTDAEVVGVALDRDFIYWAELNRASPARIMRVRRDGREATPLAEGLDDNPNGLVLLGGYLYWLDPAGISRVATDGQGLSRPFIRLPKEETGTAASGIASDGHFLYFSRCLADAIGRVEPTGRHLDLTFVAVSGCPQGLTVGGNHLYWATVGVSAEEPGFIGRAELRDGSPEQRWLTVVNGGPFELAADDSQVVWTCGGYLDDPTEVWGADIETRTPGHLFSAIEAGGLLLSRS